MRLAAVVALFLVATPPFVSAQSSDAAPGARMHRIGVRQGANVAELYDRATGETFVPRGNNYEKVSLSSNREAGECSPFWGFTTFDVEFNSTCENEPYDALAAESALARMSAEGYNVVRFNISSPEAGDLEHGVWDLYMANIADFMRRAKAHGIYVMPTTIGVPFLGGYQLRIADSEHFGSHVNRIPDTASSSRRKAWPPRESTCAISSPDCAPRALPWTPSSRSMSATSCTTISRSPRSRSVPGLSRPRTTRPTISPTRRASRE
jgi:hypothetical protein